MYCNRCNACNDDGVRFCNNCGTEINDAQPQEQDFEADAVSQCKPLDNSENLPNNQQNDFLVGTYTIALPIIAIVQNAVNFNIIGIILAIVAFRNHRKYEEALLQGDFMTADMHGRKSRRLSIAAIIVNFAVIVIVLILFTWTDFFDDLFFMLFGDSYM